MEQRVVVRADMSRASTLAFATGQAVFFSARSPVKETANEDGILIVPVGGTRGVVAVADGLGGQTNGASASEVALQSLARSVARADEGSLRPAILAGFEAANAAVLDLGLGGGTTLIAAEIDGSTVRLHHVGDTAALVVGQRGRVKLQTVRHSPVGGPGTSVASSSSTTPTTPRATPTRPRRSSGSPRSRGASRC